MITQSKTLSVMLCSLILLNTIFFFNGKTLAQTQPAELYPPNVRVQTIPLTTAPNTHVALTPNRTSYSQLFQTIPTIRPFLDVTVVELLITNLSFDYLRTAEIQLFINAVPSTTHSLSVRNEAETLQLVFLVDKHAHLQYTDPLTIQINITAEFNSGLLYFFPTPYLNLTLAQFTLFTASRETAPLHTYSRLSVALLPALYFTYNTPLLANLYRIKTLGYLVIPRDINATININLTIISNYPIDYIATSIPDFAEEAVSTKDPTTELTITLTPTRLFNNSQAIVPYEFIFSGKWDKDHPVILQMQGYWYAGYYQTDILVGTPLDWPFFLMATLIIPLGSLSPLLYRRLLSRWF